MSTGFDAAAELELAGFTDFGELGDLADLRDAGDAGFAGIVDILEPLLLGSLRPAVSDFRAARLGLTTC